MELTSGTHAIGPATGALKVLTGRSGFGARAGHDLVIEVTAWSGTVTIDAADLGASTVEVTVDATSLVVREGRGGVGPLLGVNRSEIEKTIRKVLDTRAHPEIRFVSTSVDPGATPMQVEGQLTVAGVTHPVALAVAEVDDGWRVHATVVQSHHGVKPYSAMFGALRVSDAVEVQADVTLP